ncbi:MAG: hypothetical protein J0L84_12515 [Verrucomicrobia bacterium]|nr:hypothetical protein [Verrucomicrobiota bacterium]
MLPPPPRVLLILGTDASGKDHVADFLIRRWAAAGVSVEKREGRLSASPADPRPGTERKGALNHAMEALFLRCLPWIRWLLRRVLPRLLAHDVRRFVVRKQAVIVVSQTDLRLAAFLDSEFPAPPSASRPWQESLRRLAAVPGLRVLLLRVSGPVRERRIRHRVAAGVSDPFDRLLLSDAPRARRFDDCLGRLATGVLQARVIENNDLDEEDLERAVAQALTGPPPDGGSARPEPHTAVG